MKATMNKWFQWVPETRPDVLHGKLLPVLREAGFDVLDTQAHLFEPYGFTELVLLAESHFAIHTFPEEGLTYLELSSCIDGPYRRFLELYKDLEWRPEAPTHST